MPPAQMRKETRYLGLIEEIKTAGWTPDLLTVEVGARGLVGLNFQILCQNWLSRV